MSAAPIYKIVYSYLNVLQTVKNSQNLCWDENSFSNAFKWAELCRKIFIQSKDKSYFPKLNQEISKLSELPWNLEGFKVDLNSLENSHEIFIIVLLYNKDVKIDVFKLKKFLNLLREKKLQTQLKTYSECLLELKILISCLENGKIENEESKSWGIKIIVKFFQKFSFKHVFTTKQVLETLIKQILSTKHGGDVFEASYNDLKKLQNCQKGFKIAENLGAIDFCILNFIKQNYWILSNENKSFIKVFTLKEVFLQSFLEKFFSLGQRFHISYSSKEHKVPIFEWTLRDKKDCEFLSYELLKDWVSYLLSRASKKVIYTAENQLVELIDASDVNVWRSICQELDLTELLF